MAISYYVAGNTSEGRINVLASNIEQFEKVIVLKHPSAKVKSNVIRYWIEAWKKNSSTIETFESVEGNEFLGGVIDPLKKQAIVSNTVSNDSKNITHTIDLSSYILETDSRIRKVHEHQKRIDEHLGKATTAFATGLRIHDDLEHIYIQHMDFSKADSVTLDWMNSYLPLEKKRDKKGQIKQRLFGTTTAEGAVNCVPEITQSFTKVHHVKGRAGTGKSHFMNTIKDKAISAGYDIEQYICSFDPGSTDMIIIRELGLCLFDSTDPHAFSPSEDDVVIDLYALTVDVDVDEVHKELIQNTTERYKAYMKQGIIELKEAREEQKSIDLLYAELFTEDVMDSIHGAIEQIVNR